MQKYPLDQTVLITSQGAIWQNCEDHGWHDPAADLNTDLLLITCEVAEAAEALRKGWRDYHEDHTSAEEELADVVIRVFHVCEKNGWNIARAVARKHKKNMTRPHRHGNKLF